MIAASLLLFGASAMLPVARPTEITFGQWPQVFDSVWLIATALMPENSPETRALPSAD
jgi:hypothetical protein